ncbi:MAG: HEAT repeat domain-containing protein [Planctomycetes bacterium]|nr:HEAT repeat domain-containing protein [Planctomycetota bacterium]
MKLATHARRSSTVSVLSILVGLALCAPTVAAQETAPDTAASSDAVDPNAREVRRVLSLAGGGFVRAKSRLAGDQWEYLDGTAWKSLPVDRVVHAAVERDLLAEAKRLAVGVDRDQARRGVYADWLCGAGLLTEGVKELDTLLTRDPDSKIALDTCAKLASFVRASNADAKTDAGLTEWFRAGAGFGPTMREVAVRQLGARAERETLDARLTKELGADSSRVRAFAVLALRRLRPGAELRGLASRAVLDGSEQVRHEAALALKTADEPAVVAPVVRALGSRYSSVRANAIDALGAMQYPSAIEPLIAYLEAAATQSGGGWTPPAASIFVGRQVAYVQDYDVEVAQFSAVADPQVNTLIEGSVLDVRVISAYTVGQGAEVRRVREALQNLTQANPGNSAAQWRAWWQANRARFADEAPRTNAGS